MNIIYSSGIFWLEGKIDEYNTEKYQITITDSDYEKDKISISFHYRYNETTKKYDANVYVKGSNRASIEKTAVPDGGYVNLRLFGSASNSTQDANATFKLYSLDTVWFYRDEDNVKHSITRNFVPCEAVGLQDEKSNVFLLNKDLNDSVTIMDPLYFKLNNKVGKEFTL